MPSPPPETTPPAQAHGFGTIPSPEAVRRILVCQLRQIGDVLLATPSLELLARRYPQAEIHVFTEKKCAPMLENNPHVHAVWPVDKKAFPTPVHEYIWYGKIAATGFDIVVDFQQLPRCRALALLSRAPVRLSFPPPWYLRPLYTHWAQPAPAYAGAYKAGVLAPLGITWQGERPRLYLTTTERVEAHNLLAAMQLNDKPFVSVDATHRQYTRRWPISHFAALMDMLADALPDLHFLVPFGPGEEREIHALRDICRHKERVAVPPDLLSLRGMAACMERAILHLGNCSSPRHMAVALDVPSFTLLGATGTGWQFPAPEHAYARARDIMDMPCQHCNKNTCEIGVACMEKLRPELVLPKVLEHLHKHGKKRAV